MVDRMKEITTGLACNLDGGDKLFSQEYFLENGHKRVILKWIIQAVGYCR